MSPRYLALAVVTLAWLVYAIAQADLQRWFGDAATAAALVPMTVSGVLGGWLIGAVAGVGFLASAALALSAIPTPGELLSLTLVAMAGPNAGYLAHLHRQLHGHREASAMARHDSLTGLLNRLSFVEALRREIAGAKTDGSLLAVLFVDLDRFKIVNDTFGHDVGDELLRIIAGTLREHVRQQDLVARIGGDEFTLALVGLRKPESAAAVAGKLVKVLNTPFEVKGRIVTVSASIGISVFPTDGGDPEALLKSADSAMYQVKAAGKNTFTFSTADMRSRKSRQLELERRLRWALEEGEFELRYQPQFDLKTSELVGFEALLRWRNPELGMIKPQEFVPLAEETGMIIPVGHWLLREVCHQASLWQRAGYPPIRVAVNVSVLQFAQPDFVDLVAGALRDSRLNPSYLELEVTESLLLRETSNALQTLRRLNRLNVRTVLDDFGTGYSSLAYLQQLPIQSLKIAQNFVADLPGEGGGSASAIVEAICALAHKLRKTVVAEGVETEVQKNFLARLGCDYAQGFLFSAPLLAVEAEALQSAMLRRHEQRQPRMMVAPDAVLIRE